MSRNQFLLVGNQKKNTVGLAGFIVALLALIIIISSIPYLGGILWLLGLVLSTIGLFKRPRGFAVAGFILSMLVVIVILCILGDYIHDVIGC